MTPFGVGTAFCVGLQWKGAAKGLERAKLRLADPLTLYPIFLKIIYFTYLLFFLETCDMSPQGYFYSYM